MRSEQEEAKEILERIDEELLKLYQEKYYVQTFKKTPKIATYLFAFMAGPFDFIERKESVPGRDEPFLMRIFFRKTLRKEAERVQNYMFDSALKGIHWYSEFFDFNYPFDKYDQIFCPEYKLGAMENVAAVTFSEVYLFRGTEISEFHLTKLVNIILHELCHHWFGDLVTMTWWDDLWLKETFSTYISFLCMSCDKDLLKQ